MVPNDVGYNLVLVAFLSTSLITVINGHKRSLILKALCTFKPVDPKFPGTGLSDIRKSFEKIAMPFLARTKIKGIYHQSYLRSY